jgi:serine/threonine-protein kinase
VGAQRERDIAGGELRSDVLRLRAGMLVALGLWVLFSLLDLVAASAAGPGSLLWFWSIRAAVAPLGLYALWRLHHDPPPSRRLLRALDLALYGAGSYAAMTIAAIHGGIGSPFAAGVVLVLAGRAAFTAQSWRGAFLPNSLIVSSYPVTMAVGALVSPRIRAQLHDSAAIAAAVQQIVFIVGTSWLGLAGSHFAWALRRELVEHRTIGRYELRARLGVGGMGEVWSAYHRGLRRDVALKILRSDVHQSPNAVERFEREVRATTELTHPNTVRVFDYGVTDDGIRYYAMELLHGQTLAELVAHEGALQPARAVHLLWQAARSLAEAHAHGIVHRDLKPANLFVTDAGGEADFLKVLDFGVAKRDDDVAGLTHGGELAGTPKYMAPEVVRGQPATPRSDVYGLGGVLYTLLAGRPPFEERDSASVCFAHLTESPKPPSVKRGAPLDFSLEEVVLRCLAKDPSARYADGAALAEALQALQTTWRGVLPTPHPSPRPPPPDDVVTVIGPASATLRS